MPKIKTVKPDLKVRLTPVTALPRAAFMARSLGPHISGVSMPTPATNDPYNWLGGVCKRVGQPSPTIAPGVRKKLRSFVRNLLHSEFEPLPADYDFSIDKWLEETNYTLARKEELRAVAENLPEYLYNFRDKLKTYKCKSFGKVEYYSSYKQMRIINSRSDAFKVLTGPYFHGIEKRVFESEYFIKKIPVRERARFVNERLGSQVGLVVGTDWTAFESHMVPILMEAVEFQLYAYMLKNCPKKNHILHHIKSALGGRNVGSSKFGSFSVDGVRMSGDMCTSLGNGFTNLAMMMFVLAEKGLKGDGLFEGDDGLTVVYTNDESRLPTIADFARVGGTVKLERSDNVNEAAFCKMISHPDVLHNVIDPIPFAVKFGWTNSAMKTGGEKVMLELLRGKGYSSVYEAPNGPIVRSMGDYALRVTHGQRARFDETLPGTMDWWTAQVMRDIDLQSKLPDGTIDLRSRQLVEKHFGITVERQLSIESYFNSKNDLEPIPLEVFGATMFPQDWKDDYSVHVRAVGPNEDPFIWRY